MSRRPLITVLLLVTIGVIAAASVILLVSYRPGPAPLSDAGQRAVFIGDSYTQGTGASTPALRWTSLVAAGRGWQETNLAFGGTGYRKTAGVSSCGRTFCPSYRDVVAQAVAADPQVVVVSGGQNDFRSFETDPAEVVAAIDKTYATLRRGLPDARVIAVGPSTPGKVNATVRGVDAAVQKAARANGAIYVSLIEPQLVITPEMVLPDRTHVNDDGHRAIAERVLSALD